MGRLDIAQACGYIRNGFHFQTVAKQRKSSYYGIKRFISEYGAENGNRAASAAMVCALHP